MVLQSSIPFNAISLFCLSFYCHLVLTISVKNIMIYLLNRNRNHNDYSCHRNTNLWVMAPCSGFDRSVYLEEKRVEESCIGYYYEMTDSSVHHTSRFLNRIRVWNIWLPEKFLINESVLLFFFESNYKKSRYTIASQIILLSCR